MKRAALHLPLCVVGILALTVEARGQAPADTLTVQERGAALSSVMDVRSKTLRDTTLFEACSVARALGGGDDPLRVLRENERRFVASTRGAPCDDQLARSRGGIQVMEMVPGGTGMDFSVTIRLRVWTGTRRYSEESYSIRMPNHGAHRDPEALWAVNLIQLYSAIQLP